MRSSGSIRTENYGTKRKDIENEETTQKRKTVHAREDRGYEAGLLREWGFGAGTKKLQAGCMGC